MKSYLEKIMTKLDFPDEAKKDLNCAFEKLTEDAVSYKRIMHFIEEYDKKTDIDYLAMLSTADEVSGVIGVHTYTLQLICFLCLTKRLEKYYSDAGIDAEIFTASMMDLKYKLIECKLVHNIWGSFVARWFRGFFQLERFALGRLQFELVRFGKEYESNGVKLTPDSKVLNVHIPRSGERLTPESTSLAYAKAAEFYADKLAGVPIAFVCDSWLLFPKNKELMKPGSNLLGFISDFDIYEWGYYDSYKEVWRLFDRHYTPDLSKLPADTSLRRGYLELMANGEKIGYGKGVYVYKA